MKSKEVAFLDTLIAQYPVCEGIGLDDPLSPLAYKRALARSLVESGHQQIPLKKQQHSILQVLEMHLHPSKQFELILHTWNTETPTAACLLWEPGICPHAKTCTCG